MTDTVGNIRTDKCHKICANKTLEGYCKSTACILPQTDTVSNMTINTGTYTYPSMKVYGECSSCTHCEVCKYKEDFKSAREKFLQKYGTLPILRVECEYYQSRSLNITYSDNSDPWLKPPYEFTCNPCTTTSKSAPYTETNIN